MTNNTQVKRRRRIQKKDLSYAYQLRSVNEELKWQVDRLHETKMIDTDEHSYLVRRISTIDSSVIDLLALVRRLQGELR